MTTPILLVTGFLGAGKSTVINDLLHMDHNERVAAIVNDFGAINIDAELLDGAADVVIGLKNGCICCSLQGDLLRTLKLVLDHSPAPDRIIVEASGAADPQGIVEAIMDPVLWGMVRMDAVACVIDAEDIATNPERAQDPLWLAQIRNSDFLLLNKTEGAPADLIAGICATLEFERKPMFNIAREGLPIDLLMGTAGNFSDRDVPKRPRVTSERFVTVDWESDGPISSQTFQEVLSRIAPGLLRAKGYLSVTERLGDVHLFQLVGRRATFVPVRPCLVDTRCRLVLIGERGVFDAQAALNAFAECDVAGRARNPECK